MFSREEICELFDDIQEDYQHAVARNSLREGLVVHAVPTGTKPKTPHRKMYARALTAKHLHEQIRERILAGERPKTGGRGRPPTRWWRVADQLGIDIGQPRAEAVNP